LDNEVEAKLEELLQSHEAYENYLTLRWEGIVVQLGETEETRRQATATLAGFADQVKRLNRDYRNGVLSASLYDENRREIDQETAQLKDRIAHLERLERSLAQQLHQRDALQEVFDLARRWKELTIPQRKFVLRNLIESVIAFKVKRGDELRVRVTWRFAQPNRTAN